MKGLINVGKTLYSHSAFLHSEIQIVRVAWKKNARDSDAFPRFCNTLDYNKLQLHSTELFISNKMLQWVIIVIN